ncbi:hypothetical protein WISP_84392 [Willisornis vidua]|uniref:Uncharacterized protein n=1 Tax=Willisornis vidua TaxID=1566151 RepID=A0ABQ9D416_9PASS|nr:hypothetical protein WISP_84392 [Willisornis vidua]
MWACVNLIKINKAKYKVLHRGRDNPKHKYRLSGEWIESSSVEKGLGMLVDEKLDITQHWLLADEKAIHIMSCTRKHGQQVKGDDSPPLLHSLRPHLEYCAQLWVPQHNKDIDVMKQVQRRATKMIRELE